MGKGRVEEVFQEEGSVDVRAQSKEQASTGCAGEEQAGQSGWIMERSMKKEGNKRGAWGPIGQILKGFDKPCQGV